MMLLHNLNFQFSTGKTALNRHLYEVHGQEVDCRCALCDKFFTDSVALNRHDKRVHGTIAEEPHCIDCELYFSRVSLYNRHKHEKHAMEPEFYCETCDKYFDGKWSYFLFVCFFCLSIIECWKSYYMCSVIQVHFNVDI